MSIALGPTTVTPAPAGADGYGEIAGAPVSGPITSPYGAWEDWRRARGWGPHQGLDIGCDEGTPVICPASGKVIVCGFDPIDGNYLHVQIDGESAIYGLLHFRDPLPYSVGDHIDRGSVIGPAGMTGAATGPHVHLCLGFVVNGEALPWLDPAPYLTPTITPDAPTPVPVPPADAVPVGFYPDALARLEVYARTRGLAGSGGVGITDDGDHFTVTVRK